MENRLDKIDLGILKLLEKDARISHKEIAHLLNLSITPIHARIRKLQDGGYIQRYTAIINHKLVGRGLIAYTQVHLKEHSQESLKAFMEATIKLPEVMECYHMTGAFDFLLRIAIKDMDEYNKVLIEKLSKLPDVGNMQSFFVMSAAKHETGYMFDKT
ncbi:Lrp/AsnC family transcriptional regulator [Mucilaginibacter flavus]|uniref:Lrp/AsnC family transcriptional regulator n=1 Tax=Mucilaginibacter flavus TaxID=931504 RepID=UPI0025B511DE|nr:Lrp/AsnC family transcriptional regulator [Mucilaginibacter flavus]MDN3584505.1 Lrp/AsnC family transcriptional regulator [Mucilaginibacter flavus]